MKNVFFASILMLLLSCGHAPETTKNGSPPFSPEEEREKITTLLNNWHKAAGDASFEEYFEKMTENGIFIGTDPTENWETTEFKKWSKPYFDRDKAWSFCTLERNIYFSDDRNTGWFDELLDTQMGICRGSGVIVKEEGSWKIKHYVLSIAIPNEKVPEVTNIKKEFDSSLISQFKNQ